MYASGYIIAIVESGDGSSVTPENDLSEYEVRSSQSPHIRRSKKNGAVFGRILDSRTQRITFEIEVGDVRSVSVAVVIANKILSGVRGKSRKGSILHAKPG